MLEITILSLAFMLHMWSFPYPFKTLKIEIVIRIIQIIFSITIMYKLYPASLTINPVSVTVGILIGMAMLIFHLIYNRGIKVNKHPISYSFILSHLLLLVIIPAEELLYRGIFFQILLQLWGIKIALLLSVPLSTMIYITIWRKPLYWLGAGLVNTFSSLAFYYTGNIWASIILHLLNELGITLVEGENAFIS